MRPAYNVAVSYKLDDAVSPMDHKVHPVLHEGRVGVITGAAGGIGRAAAIELAKLGLKIAITDVDEEGLNETAKIIIGLVGEANVLVVPTNVAKLDEVVRLKDKIYEAWGEVAVLLNNAAIGFVDGKKGTSWENLGVWTRVFDVNVAGVLNVQHTFVPVRHFNILRFAARGGLSITKDHEPLEL